MSFSGSSASRNNNCATSESDTWSLIPVPKKIILSLNNLEYISKALSPLPDCSITVGTAAIVLWLLS